ncbi:MAG: SPFH domain-containing protein, partial [Lawsonibacter sp.]|nr:SPFH domain-containing protein [Lawsonibacter sp.]
KITEIIQYEGGNDMLVWKHPSEDFNTGSQLIVHESQEAIFFCNGQALDLFGPGRHTLKTENIPLLRHLLNLPTGGQSPFHCEVYFINKAIPMDLKWGGGGIVVLDPKFQILLHTGANGGMGIQIGDSRKFLIKFVGTQQSFSTETLIRYFKEMIMTRVKSHLTSVMSQVSFVIVNSCLNDISSSMHQVLQDEMEEFGVKLVKFFVSGIQLAQEDYEKVQNSLAVAASRNIEGYNWVDEQIASITTEYAKNPGSQNNVGSMMGQMPVAFAFGQMMRGAAKPLMDQAFSQQSKAFSASPQSTQAAAPASPFGSAPGMLRPKGLSVPQPGPSGGREPGKKFCPNCGQALAPDARFCSGCGNRISSPSVCKTCGRELSPEERFCPNCGAKKEE